MKEIKNLFRKFLSKGQMGGVLIYVAAGIIPFAAMLGLVLDYGEAVVAREKMQRSVDAAALAGATALPSEWYESTGTSPEHRAVEVVGVNYQKYDNYTVSVATDTVTVDMDRAVPTRFMRLFGVNTLGVGVDATAYRGSPISRNTGHIMPFCILNPNTNRDPADDLVPSNWGKQYVLAYGEPNIAPQDWANGDDPPPENPSGVGSGQGWRSALRLNSDGSMGGGGASDFRDVFMSGWPGTAGIDDVVPVLTGNIDGPIRQGREGRLAGEEGLLFSDFDPDKGFIHNRIVLVPIVSLLHDGSTTDRLSIDEFDSGIDWDHTNVIIDGFAPFWLLTVEEQGDVNGDGNPGDEDWITGYFIPGTRVPTGSEGGGYDYGLLTPPRLID